MEYNLASFPNHFGQTTQAEAGYVVNLLTTLHSSSDCWQRMTSLACGLLFPKCANDSKPLPVCRHDCYSKLDNLLVLPIKCREIRIVSHGLPHVPVNAVSAVVEMGLYAPIHCKEIKICSLCTFKKI